MTGRASIGDFVSQASFWKPDYVTESAWFEHAPFAFWLVEALSPRTFVELGTHLGFSYLSVCQAMDRLETPSKAFAVDTWKGDEHSGFYGEEVFKELSPYHDSHYSAFSRLVRSTFDDAVGSFEDGSIDLLHIDGLHAYDAVRHDFDTWRPKLSERSVVLLHDTNVRERGFGVHQVWAELRSEHAGFEFVHGHGLGVLGFGPDLPGPVNLLLRAEAAPKLTAEIRQVYTRLGGAIRLEFDLAAELAAAEKELSALQDELEIREAELAALEEKLAAREAELAARADAEAAQLAAREAELAARADAEAAQLAARETELAARADAEAAQQAHLDELEHQLHVVLASESWRVTAPLRFVGSRLRRVAGGATDSTGPTGPNGPTGPADAGRADGPGASRRRIVESAKPFVPARARGYLRRRFPAAVGAVMNAPGVRSRTPSVDELLAERFPSLRPLSVYPVPSDGRKHLTLVTDSLSAGSLFGGVGTSLILAALLARRLGASLRIVTRTEAPEPTAFATVLRAHGIPWDENVEFLYSSIDSNGKGISSRSTDVFLTTSWWGTWSALAAVDPNRIVYLLQEDERLFYPAGDEQVMCSEVLADPRIRFVVNTTMLYEYFVGEGFENIRERGSAFEPAFPESIYFPDRARGKQRSFFFYARPNNDRNLFLRGLEAVRASLVNDVLHPDEWEFNFVGKDIPHVELPYGVVPKRSENLPWPEYAALIRGVDVGLSLMSSPHPSYPPLDLAACGAVAVTNRFGPKQNLERYSANIICADLSTDGLAEGIAEAVRLAGDDRQRGLNRAAEGLCRDWPTSFRSVVDELAESL